MRRKGKVKVARIYKKYHVPKTNTLSNDESDGDIAPQKQQGNKTTLKQTKPVLETEKEVSDELEKEVNDILEHIEKLTKRFPQKDDCNYIYTSVNDWITMEYSLKNNGKAITETEWWTLIDATNEGDSL